MEEPDLLSLRKTLHQNAELSDKEENTAKIIHNSLEKLDPDRIITDIGGNGIAAVFNDKSDGKTIVLRAELDALPIPEVNDFDHKSLTDGVAHKCGHDGHMTILLGAAQKILKEIKELPGRLVILFQPAEETAQGAKRVLADKKFTDLKPDYMFALHNLPGFGKGSIILRENVFASASTGFIVRLKGETSHAGHPANGRNPVLAMTQIIQSLMGIPSLYTGLDKACNLTIIHAKLGEVAFGTSPGAATVMATLRSHEDSVMEIMSRKAQQISENIAATYDLEIETEWVEVFPATVNDDECFKVMETGAQNLGRKIIYKDVPFPWSEDFGYYTQNFKCGFFGLGSGKNHPQLHNSNYDFPEDIINHGIDMFFEIVKRVM